LVIFNVKCLRFEVIVSKKEIIDNKDKQIKYYNTTIGKEENKLIHIIKIVIQNT